MNMIVAFESIENMTVDQACNVMRNQDKKRISDLRILDLIMQNDEALPFVHGIYMFFKSDGISCLYVGRVMSPQFIERVPSHFAISEASWSNQFLKAHKEHGNFTSLHRAAISARDCHILMVPIPHELIKGAEKLFILYMEPKYNKRRPNANNKDSIPKDMSVASAIQVLQT